MGSARNLQLSSHPLFQHRDGDSATKLRTRAKGQSVRASTEREMRSALAEADRIQPALAQVHRDPRRDADAPIENASP
jgi:hypothetical protein